MTCRNLIARAMRKLTVLGAGESPGASEATDALEVLQGLYDGWLTAGLFGAMTDVIKSADYTAKEFERVRKDAACTITIPTTYEDDDTGLTRPPRDLSVIQVLYPATDARETHIYDATLGEWVRIEALTLDTTPPLFNRNQDGLACCLAEMLADEYQAQLGVLTAAKAAAFRSNLGLNLNNPVLPGQPAYF